jgi:hypothetical protein
MHKALVIKELRESAGLIAVAVLAAVFIFCDIIGIQLLPFLSGRPSTYPFVNDTALFSYLTLLGASLAIGLGFKQSAWELWHGSYYFLLHRPASRRSIFGVKLAFGVGVLLVITGSLIQLYAMWAATPGTHATPFLWSMTAWAWQYWLAFPILYLSAFLSGIRPGRWFGSRLFPLVTAVLATIVVIALPWWWLSALLSLLFSAAFVQSILYYAQTRDY